jgi:hypothetical protein
MFLPPTYLGVENSNFRTLTSVFRILTSDF